MAEAADTSVPGQSSDGAPSPAGTAGHRTEDAREALTMALYVSLSLQAVLLTTPAPEADSSRTAEALTLFLTALGLLVAHQVAFRMSSRMVNRGVVDPESLSTLRAQAVGGLPVAILAALPILLLGADGLVIAELALLAFVGVIGYQSVRRAGVTRRRAWGYVIFLVVVVTAVLALKILVKH